MRTRHLPDTAAAHFVVLVPGHVYRCADNQSRENLVNLCLPCLHLHFGSL